MPIFRLRCIFYLTALLALTASAPPIAAQTDPPAPEASAGTIPSADQAGDKPLDGHSHYGHTFNEGPRQAAYLMGNTGNIDFPVTTRASEAQAFFNQGVGQLHGFWYFEAERSFRHAAMLDPDCPMAYWGMAHANIDNPKRARGFIKKAVNDIGACNEHEQLRIRAFADYLEDGKKGKEQKAQRKAYVEACRAIMERYPDNIEAKAFWAYATWYNGRKGVTIEDYDAVSAVIDQIHAVEPTHPAHHYKIHLWDYKDPAKALDAAASGGPSGPAIAHLWHMPGHTYSHLHRYRNAAWQQEASARVDHAHMIRDRVMPDQIHNYAHNNEWLVRNLINVGRARDALSLAKNMTELPRHPEYNTFARKRGSASYGRKRLIDTLKQFEMWEQAIELCGTGYLDPTDDFANRLARLNLLGTSHYLTKDVAAGDQVVEELRVLQRSLTNEAKALVDQAADQHAEAGRIDTTGNDEGKQKAQAIKAAAKKLKSQGTAKQSEAKRIDTVLGQLAAHHALANDEHDEAAVLYEKVKAQLGDLMMSTIYLALDKQDQALAAADKYAESKKHKTVVSMANLAYVQHLTGNRDAAAKTFATLRELASDADMDTRPMMRLTALARTSGCAGDWRLARQPPTDTRQTLDLDTLGPFRWRPYKAAPWKLPDANGRRISLDDFKGKPVLVIFYLGFGCLHCVEQLNAFAPVVKQYKDAGIEIVAISSDSVEGLGKSAEFYNEEGAFPFTIVSNQSLEVFKEYRAYDDFEEMTLHGTYLIDGKGHVRWQDISYEPFTQPEFLLKESKRLLAQPDEVVYGESK